MKSALAGIRILDLTDSVIGPFVTMLLAHHGAEVIKVDSRMHLGFRRLGPWGPKGNAPIPQAPEETIDFSKVRLDWLISPMFAQLNSNKLSMTLNLSKPEGRDLFKRLVKVSDVVVDNFRFGVMQKWGLDYSNLKQIKSALVVASLQALGRGPYEKWTTWAMNVMSYAWFTQGWGYPDTSMEERIGSGYYCDYIAGGTAAAVIVAALFHRARTGKGQYIELSQAEVAASAMGPAYLDYFVNYRIAPPVGNRHRLFAPYNCYRCRGDDAWCVIAVRDDEEWQQLCVALEQPSWIKDPKFKDRPNRLKNVEELDRNIEKWTSWHTPHQVMGILQYHGVAAGVVQNGEDLYHDIQLRARGFMVDQDLPRLGSITFAGMPVRPSSGSTLPYQRAPWLGEHNDYVYGQLLGLDENERKRLEEAQVIY
jgi:benzylsuccinate CoA-transferase BbsF subunit